MADAVALTGFDQGKFLAGASDMLDGVEIFWDGDPDGYLLQIFTEN